MLGRQESGNRYNKTNTLGYVGRWQMGGAALARSGYVQPGTDQAGLKDPANWTGKDGVASLDEFLANKGNVQDKQFLDYQNKNYAEMVRNGVIRPEMTQKEIAGWLGAGHLGGAGGAKALAQGQDRRDAYGTSVSSYYNRFSAAGEEVSSAAPKQASALGWLEGLGRKAQEIAGSAKAAGAPQEVGATTQAKPAAAGGFDPARFDFASAARNVGERDFSSAFLGPAPGAVSNDNSRKFEIGGDTINITTSGDPKEAASVLGYTRDRTNADLLRNLQGAVR
jgi:hypothetical protein